MIREKQLPEQTLACLVIDDPFLRPQYGCLNYERLLQEMEEHRFFSEIAFIPWNYKRTHPKTAQLFLDNRQYFSLCIHGYNHTGGEFASTDYSGLSHRSFIAMKKMEEHERETGLSFDRVIVFPQGKFSSVALEALKRQGYHGAVNSTLSPVDGKPLPPDFPLILRRYPHHRDGFIQDMAQGRPIIMVEHHAAFRGDMREITDCVDWINNESEVKWCSLGEIVKQYYPYYKPNTECAVPYADNLDSVAVTLRHALCELRDNYIERFRPTARLYRLLRRVI